MSTKNVTPDIQQALAAIPDNLRSRLIRTYSDLKTASLHHQYDAVGLRAGKLAEILVRVLQYLLTNTHTPLTSKLGNFEDECKNLEKTPKAAGLEGLHILMPRALSFLYTLRNKRDCGHVGGEVDANQIDALTGARVADWCLCELIRVCRGVPIEDAQMLCKTIAERHLPKIWSILGRKRVLDSSLNYRDQTLLLIYSEVDTGVATEDLFRWTEHSHRTRFRQDVLYSLHKARLIEWDQETDMAIISPTGVDEVERRVLPALENRVLKRNN